MSKAAGWAVSAKGAARTARALLARASVAALAWGAWTAAAWADPGRVPYYVVMDPPIVYPGAIVRIQVSAPGDATGGSVAVAGRRFFGRIEEGIFTAYFAVDVDTLPGPYELRYDVGSRRGLRVVTVRARRFDEEGRFAGTVSDIDLALERLTRTNPRLLSLWNRYTMERYWSGAFLTPTAGSVGATFGMRRVTEKSIGEAHTGVDLLSTSGAPVVSASVGVVAMVADAPGGKFVALDHGEGLYTYYAGLLDVLVPEGKYVSRGVVLGHLPGGTSPLLHFGARLGGAQVDPVTLPGIPLRVPDLPPEARRAPSEERDKRSDYDY